MKQKFFVFCIFFSFSLKTQDHSFFSQLKKTINYLKRKHKSARISVEIASAERQKPIFQCNAHEISIPASILKLITAVHTLTVLTPDFRYETKLSHRGNTLYLTGSGDPSFATEDLELLLVELIKKQGKKITGNIILDTSVFERRLGGYGWQHGGIYSKCAISGLNLDHNYIGEPYRGKTINSPVLYVARTIRRLFRKQGVIFKGKILTGMTPENTEIIATHESAPLHELVTFMMKYSDNLYADSFFKTLGVYYFGAPGTWEKGQKAVKEFLENVIQLSPKNYTIVDGSGLSRQNRLSPNHFNTILRWAYDHCGHFDFFLNSFPQAGTDGTLKKRLLSLSDNAQVQAKTGQLSGVNSLSGYITHPEETFMFTILINGKGHYVPVVDKICETIVQHINPE